ncbi:MAG: HIT family protein [Planctomycetota bacterium]|nr:HIT family protein [Planctomycetota bacterium]MDA1105711.1 HIT family protein [Planctomycetota bacterium]
MATIFTKIINREIPCHLVHEDAHTIAFLDIGPLSDGHVLVVPKEEREFLHQLSDESAAALGRAVARVSRALVEELGCTAYNILQNNGADAHQAVPHVHFHVIPKAPDGRGLGIQWKPGAIDHAAGAALCARLSKRMKPQVGDP